MIAVFEELGGGRGEAGLGARRQGVGTGHPARHHALYLTTHATRRDTHRTRGEPGEKTEKTELQ